MVGFRFSPMAVGTRLEQQGRLLNELCRSVYNNQWDVNPSLPQGLVVCASPLSYALRNGAVPATLRQHEDVSSVILRKRRPSG